MWIALILILISSIASIIILWNDELIESKKIAKLLYGGKVEKRKEKLKKKSSLKIKVISSFFILLTLAITSYQINASDKDKLRADSEKLIQHINDSTKNAKDSLIHFIERKEDSIANARIDSIRNLQINAYSAQLSAGQSIDSIKKKSADIISSLYFLNNKFKSSLSTLYDNTELQNKSFKVLKSQIDSAAKMLSLSNEMLHFFNNEDSLVTIRIFRKNDYVVFEALNNGYYSINFLVVNFPNYPLLDTILLRYGGSYDNNQLTEYEDENLRKQVEFSIDGRRTKEFYRYKISDLGKVYEYSFDVKWGKKYISYSYKIKFLKNKNEQLLISQNH